MTDTTFLEAMGITTPIIQAPMAGVQGSALAIAVCEAGGLGSLPCAMLSLDDQRREIELIRAQTTRPFNVNYFCHVTPTPDEAREQRWRDVLAPYYEELGVSALLPTAASRLPFDAQAAALITELRPAVVSFQFGLPPAELLAQARASGARIIGCATTVAEGEWLERAGVDAVIAQGWEAGGHRGMFLTLDVTTQVGTLALVGQLVKRLRVPVIAAGGIADAHAVRAALTLGAAAVQVGTAYLRTPEATTTSLHRQALASSASEHTAVTNVFTGRPARGIVNRLIREVGPMTDLAPAFPLAYTYVAPLRTAAEAQLRDDFSPLWAGQDTTGCRAVAAGDITRALAGLG